MKRTPPERWPVFGGWEFLLEDGDLSSSDLLENEIVVPDEDEEGGDSSGMRKKCRWNKL